MIRLIFEDFFLGSFSLGSSLARRGKSGIKSVIFIFGFLDFFRFLRTHDGIRVAAVDFHRQILLRKFTCWFCCGGFPGSQGGFVFLVFSVFFSDPGFQAEKSGNLEKPGCNLNTCVRTAESSVATYCRRRIAYVKALTKEYFL